MRTLFTFHYPADPNAGGPGVTWRLGREYEKLGHEVEFYSLDDLPKKLPPLARFILFPEFTAAKILHSHRHAAIDVIDASTADAWIWGLGLQKLQKQRPLLVARCHGLEHIEHLEYLEESQRGHLKLEWKYPLYRGSIRLWEVATSMRQSDLVLLLNQRDRDFVVEQLGVHPDRAHIVANGIPETMLNLPFEPTPAEPEPIRIAQVSSYIVRKGIQYGTPALNALLKRYPKIEVSLFGTECSADQVYADFDPEVRDRVTVIPYYENHKLPELLKGHHIKVLPTISEGFGVALVEAMACGLAPVTTTAPGPLEIVRDRETGMIVPCRDCEAFEQAIETLILDRAFLDRLRHNAYRSAQRYSWQNIAQDNLNFYEMAQRMRA
ncbi:glycosyl transferase, group 1 family protein [Leptolyngbya boryana NIES-2135]|jgi:glycosyltransferase involved in cell wall biosynthesis|uniref:Glycosyl transferase, group 1 family protein n=1 Tax=Leptolyngbya boryana NIES-2135 TaxID=1973484 RepID=A0A1Z4J9P5_LEPBY|nr:MULTISPECIES: glycosyltransferase family 4 protein [Leptolyngbya]BAY53499.1 glycosyl transferase, group 1 family protein [Leptolyngbya boryana NIES-2135]MBD2366641.1 glycosyltransferase family 4 protein [Leptolyngbya sp. FACHB-161]MBD2373346.1 glycosyltransferase family 4 protein [Leptolyngbya sp. FACHB-238]MBD2397745.1 glycosyltransferase family 4 protein [Leptolyngbya sp. FACHB-239]MBD2407405.1 glycosyltransferase family 4 protein [Leptolyngbya sp. FACHB-402]